jgi:hypothetical protein
MTKEVRSAGVRVLDIVGLKKISMRRNHFPGMTLYKFETNY